MIVLVGLWDGYDGKEAMVKNGPRVYFLVETQKEADELVQFMEAWIEARADDYGEAFVAKTYLPGLVTPSAKVLNDARTALEEWLEEVSS